MGYQYLLTEVKDGVLILTLNRPEKFNALSNDLWLEIYNALDEVKNDDNVRAVVITGAGKAFCAGGDAAGIKEGFGGNVGTYRKMREKTNRTIQMIAEYPKIVICALNGIAAGGGIGIALASDLIFASEKGRMAVIFTNIGLTLDSASSFFLPRRIGLAKAKELMLTHRIVEAPEALEMGLVDKVFPPEKLMEETLAFAKQIAQGPSTAFTFGKYLLNRGYENDLQTMLDMEMYTQIICAGSEDHREGIAAFVEKRKPVYIGK